LQFIEKKNKVILKEKAEKKRIIKKTRTIKLRNNQSYLQTVIIFKG